MFKTPFPQLQPELGNSKEPKYITWHILWRYTYLQNTELSYFKGPITFTFRVLTLDNSFTLS